MDDCDIKIDREGVWFYKGAHMFRKEILGVFFEHLTLDENGRYLIELGPERCYLDVEDTAFVVVAVYKTNNCQDNREQLEIVLNDDFSEILNVQSLYVGKENVLYCRVKEGKYPARFSRKSYYQITEFIEQAENGNGFFIALNGEQFFINHDQAD